MFKAYQPLSEVFNDIRARVYDHKVTVIALQSKFESVILKSHYTAARGLLATDLVIVFRNEVTRKSLDLVFPSLDLHAMPPKRRLGHG
ncbi:hypothetical protein TNCV_4259491 [Trichonephila clavipes]|nr:hypothetical protein TNCV_4259491 [Trichonephila clavipes]